ncbi:hypothetical protein K0U91_13390 [Chryseobacterium chendengshani]|uniref:hypothetical protein n=1 Tax=Chryseobacterium sp. LJ668 TaxID=2864040 RepID=UPI001C68AD4C|nr:hypothetical protein [Chryseobacterium sp. LJ668]MBW8522497.1 hypothetical protein [Chryseobacterium sp. LJ668]QYK16037.1 hypothetical protein K0U91_13390 [Chryseobacterium sp. LJ668]
MKKIPKLGCGCEKPGQSSSDYRTSKIGTDKTNERDAEVSVLQCRLCQRIWIIYLVNSKLPQSEKWFRGIVAKKDLSSIIPENAVQHLENLEWYLYGGSYFESEGTFGEGKIIVDI